MDELGVKLNGPVSSWNLDYSKYIFQQTGNETVFEIHDFEV
jgi:hypothetical protein